VVGLVDRATTEGVLEHRVGLLRLGDHHHPGGPDVESLHDPLAFGGTAGRDPEAGPGEVAHDRRPGPARAGVHGDADGLVDDDDRLVVVEDVDALDDLGHDLHRVDDLRDRDVEQRALVHPLRFGHRLPVDEHQALGHQFGGAGPAQAEHPGQGRVDPLTREALGHQHGALLAGDTHDRSPSRVPSTRTPRNACRMITPAATLMQMSATLKIGKFGNARKSTTWPRNGAGSRNSRSVRLPSTPASRKPRATPQPGLASRRSNHSTTPAAAMATNVSATVYSVPMLNAAPGFRAY